MATADQKTSELEAKLNELLALPPADRLWLSDRLSESVPLFNTPEEQRASDEEIVRRIEALESGRDPGIPAEQVLAEIEERLSRKRAGEPRS